MPDGQGGSLVKELIEGGLGYVWFAFLALWGGTVNYISRLKRNHSPFSIVELVGEWTVSAFAGIITAMICQEMGFSLILTSALAGISGHMGGRAIFVIEQMLANKLGIKLERRSDDEPRSKD